MKGAACLIRQTASGWIVSIGDLQPIVLSIEDTKPAGLADSVVQYLDGASAKYGDCKENIVLCPDSRSALFATSPLPHSVKSRDRQQLKYHAESLLPLDAEKMAAAFVLTAKELRVMAIDRDEWQPIIDAFASRELHFRWIAPASILALEEARRAIGENARVVIWEEDDTCDLWQLDAAGIVRWTHLDKASDDRELAFRLFASQATGARTWIAIHCNPATLAQLQTLDGIEVRSIELKSQATLATAAAERICGNSFEAWYDLRDGSIAGSDRYRALYGWMRIAAAAVATLSLAISLSCYWKSLKADGQLAKIDEMHQALYKEIFPNQNDVPPQVHHVIFREYQQIFGETGGKGDTNPVHSALEMLHVALQALKSDGKLDFRASDLKIENGILEMELTFNSEEDAIAFEARLLAMNIKLEPFEPQTDKNDKRKIKVHFKQKR